uniref:Uncharacterized protein n=1 Tax=Cuerna arida TaxID=1464854 RepID=A0A1B6FPQ5_9HEMI
MGARQSRQSVNITTPPSAASKDVSVAAEATEAAATANTVSTKEVTADIIGESGSSAPGKIERIPDSDIIVDAVGDQDKTETAAATVDEAAEPKSEAVKEPIVDASAGDAAVTTGTAESTSNAADSAKKGKKLKKKWSLRNISFTRKDKNKAVKEDKEKAAAPVAAAAIDEPKTAKEAADESAVEDLNAVSDSTDVKDKDKMSVIQETIKEEETTTTTTATTVTTTVAEVFEDAAASIPNGMEIDVEVTVSEPVSITDNSLSDKMNQLSIVEEEKVEAVVQEVEPKKTEVEEVAPSCCNGLTTEVEVEVEVEVEKEPMTNGTESSAKPESVAVDMLPEPVVELSNGDNCVEIVHVNGTDDDNDNDAVVVSMNGNGIEPCVENAAISTTSDSCSLSSPSSIVNQSAVIDINDQAADIVAKKNVQKQVLEKAQELIDLDENGVDHVNVMESTNGFVSGETAIVKE